MTLAEIDPPASQADPAVLAALADLSDPDGPGARYLAAARSPATREVYANHWTVFTEWLSDTYGTSLPEADINGKVSLTEAVHPALVIRFVTDLAEHRRHATLSAYLSAIRYHHRASGLPSPTDHPQVTQVLDGIRREHMYRTWQARPLYLAELAAAVGQLDDMPQGPRDRALLLVGWWGAFRASELVGLDVSDVSQHPEGIVVTLDRSKTDQAGVGREVAIHYHDDPCPVLALRAWLADRITEGPIFRRLERNGALRVGRRAGRLGRHQVIAIVKRAAASIGLDPRQYSAHSLRAGFVSECDRRGVPPGAVRAVTGHKTEAMLSLYSRPGQLFKDSAGSYFENMET